MRVLSLLLFVASAAATVPIGFNSEFYSQVDGHITDDTALIAASGAKIVRYQFSFNDFSPSAGVYDWTLPDAAFNATFNKGMKMLALMAYGAPYMSSKATWNWNTVVTNYSAYGTACAAFAARYKNKGLAYMEIWNEPNLSSYWGDSTPSATNYYNLIKAAYPLIKAQAPNVLVSSAGTAPAGGSYEPGAWIQTLITKGMLSYCDVVAMHPYTGGVYPVTGVYEWQAIARVEQSIANAGKTHKIILTELGWATASQSGDGLTQAAQASLYSSYFDAIAADSKIAAATFYEFRDAGTDNTNDEDMYGVITNAGVQKSAYTTFKNRVGAFA